MKKIFILDTMALIYRAHFAMIKSPTITTYGLNTSAIYGFINTFFKLIEKNNPTHIVAAIDSFEETVRQETAFDYKANRDAQPEDITIAIPHLENFFELMGIKLIRYPGYEADDIIGTIVENFKNQDVQIYIVSMDKDFAQLLTEKNIFIYKPGAGYQAADIILDQSDILKKWDIENVDQVRDVLGLQGDTSDNIPGVPSVGPKTASKLLKSFGSVEKILENVDNIQGHVGESLKKFSDQAIISKKLATIFTDLDIKFSLDDIKLNQNNSSRLLPFLEKLEFKSLIKKINTNSSKIDDSETHSIHTSYRSLNKKDFAVEYARRKDSIRNEIGSCVSILILENTIWLHFSEPATIYFVSADSLQKNQDLQNFFADIINDKDIEVLSFGGKELLHFLSESHIKTPKDLKDLQLLINLLYPEYSANIDSLSRINEIEIPEYELTYYYLPYFKKIYDSLALNVKNKNLERILDLEMKVLYCLFSMERSGVYIDKELLLQLKRESEDKVSDFVKEIHQLAGEKFNVSSPKQLGIILFEKLMLKEKPKKTKSGQYATNEETLLEISDKSEIVRKILDYRELQKVISTYLEGIYKLLDEKSFLHTTYSQIIASTGRVTSKNPNLQNIPIKTPLGKKIRTMFVSREQEGVMMSADYSQIELRVIAHLSEDAAMLDAFANNRDIHADTAAKVFKVNINDVSQEMRRQAKSVNFGIVYGISSFGLAKQLGIRKNEAADIINAYFQEFPSIKKYMDDQIISAKEKGYVKTMMGRHYYLRDINSRNNVIRNHAERNAINTPIQGSAAEIIKLATVKVCDFFEENKLKSKMVMQVHDELVFDVVSEEITTLEIEVKKIMQNIDFFGIPLKVDLSYGKNWLGLLI